MKKGLMIVFALWLIAGRMYGQGIVTRQVQAVEVEVAVGTCYGLNKSGYDNNRWGKTARAEVKYCLPTGLMDFGLGVATTRFERVLSNPQKAATFPTLNVYTVCNYNWIPKNYLSAFVGLELGASHWVTLSFGNAPETTPKVWSPMIAPRIGIELWERLRLTASLIIATESTSYYGFTVGYSFGGKKR